MKNICEFSSSFLSESSSSHHLFTNPLRGEDVKNYEIDIVDILLLCVKMKRNAQINKIIQNWYV